MAWTDVLFDPLFLVASYVVTAVVAISIYETARYFVRRAVKRRMERSLRSFLSAEDLYAQSFKFTNKLVIKELLLSEPEVRAAVLEEVATSGADITEVRRRAETYVEEIVPEFQLFTTYRFGYGLAKAVVHGIYDPVVDKSSRGVLDSLPKDATKIYVVNHRSSMDFILLSYVLAGKVSMSYAVGEWARGWPFEPLFKAFGSYMVRRGDKDALYRTILERFVRLQTRHGVVQAFFPEGSLTRHGYLLAPKLGLLSWLVKEAKSPGARPLVFIPVGVNYDRVVETENMIREAQGRANKRSFGRRVYDLTVGPIVGTALLLYNIGRVVLNRPKRHGHASIAFGQPLVYDGRGQAGSEEGTSDEALREHVAGLGDELIGRIARAVPATATTVVSAALMGNPAAAEGRTTKEVAEQVGVVFGRLREQGVPVVTGHAFRRFHRDLARLEPEENVAKVERPLELDAVSREVQHDQEAEALARYGLDVLRRQRVLRRRRGRWLIRPEREATLRYNANSIGHHLGSSWPIGGWGDRPPVQAELVSARATEP